MEERQQQVSGAGMADARVLAVSIVSHGHDRWLPGLLAQIAATGRGMVGQVIVTHNLPPAGALAVDAGWPFTVTERRNARPLGFGANHNRAFAAARAPLFCVLNPDIVLSDAHVWAQLCAAAQAPGVGCAYPLLRNPDGTPQDSQRAALTPWALVRRRVLRRAEARVDWVSAAFWVVPGTVFRALGGFDERYFMYCEDADFCMRLQLRGWRMRAVAATAVHAAQRGSHRHARHLAWHLRSLLRLWCGGVLWRYAWRRGAMGRDC